MPQRATDRGLGPDPAGGLEPQASRQEAQPAPPLAEPQPESAAGDAKAESIQAESIQAESAIKPPSKNTQQGSAVVTLPRAPSAVQAEPLPASTDNETIKKRAAAVVAFVVLLLTALLFYSLASLGGETTAESNPAPPPTATAHGKTAAPATSLPIEPIQDTTAGTTAKPTAEPTNEPTGTRPLDTATRPTATAVKTAAPVPTSKPSQSSSTGIYILRND